MKWSKLCGIKCVANFIKATKNTHIFIGLVSKMIDADVNKRVGFTHKPT